MLGAFLFCGIISGITYLGIKIIRSSVIKFIFSTFTFGIFSMIVIPAVWHAVSSYEKIGFLGFDSTEIHFSQSIILIYFASTYLYFFTTLGFCIISHFLLPQIGNLEISEDIQKFPFLPTMVVFYGICIFFFLLFYDNFNSVLQLRGRESFDLPIYFELLRGALIGACTYATMKITTTRFTRDTFEFVTTLGLFIFSLILIAGFGSRNLIVFPAFAIFLSLKLKHDQALLRRNYVLGGAVLLLFFALTLAQSNFRDQGFDQMDITQFHFSSLFLAFDQFDSMYLAFQTYDSFDRPQNRWPFAILSDIFTYYFPREWFKSLGITKLSHINYLEWNAYITGDIKSNVTPSLVGQALIENKILGILFLPFNLTIILFFLLKILEKKISKGGNNVIILTYIVLISGGIFNIVRMFSGAYLIYFFVFFIIVYLIEIIVKIKRVRKEIA